MDCKYNFPENIERAQELERRALKIDWSEFEKEMLGSPLDQWKLPPNRIGQLYGVNPPKIALSKLLKPIVSPLGYSISMHSNQSNKGDNMRKEKITLEIGNTLAIVYSATGIPMETVTIEKVTDTLAMACNESMILLKKGYIDLDGYLEFERVLQMPEHISKFGYKIKILSTPEDKMKYRDMLEKQKLLEEFSGFHHTMSELSLTKLKQIKEIINKE